MITSEEAYVLCQDAFREREDACTSIRRRPRSGVSIWASVIPPEERASPPTVPPNEVRKRDWRALRDCPITTGTLQRSRPATRAAHYRARNPCVIPPTEYVPTISP
jgi:hypothetical protein